jgi:MarR family transcriptional regulator for hemolysin
MDTIDRNVGFLLHDTARLLRKRFEQKARDLRLTRAQWQVLAHLARNQGIHQGALADLLEIEPITLVRILDRLQSAGLIERRHHAADRRVWRLYLTEAAHPILDQIRTIAAATREEAFAGMAPEDRERLVDLLIALRANLSRGAAEGDDEDKAPRYGQA